QKSNYEGMANDFEFSAASMRDHWQAGYRDTTLTIGHKEWLSMKGPAFGVVMHDIHRPDESPIAAGSRPCGRQEYGCECVTMTRPRACSLNCPSLKRSCPPSRLSAEPIWLPREPCWRMRRIHTGRQSDLLSKGTPFYNPPPMIVTRLRSLWEDLRRS